MVYQLAPGCSISIETEDSSQASTTTTTTTAMLNLDENGVLTLADVAVDDFDSAINLTAVNYSAVNHRQGVDSTPVMAKSLTTAASNVAAPSADKSTTAKTTIADDGTIYIPIL